MSSQKIYLALLWHQHQPFYKDLRTGRAIMPWTRLHATKDYYDMAAIIEEFPRVRMTINLVPSLVVQLQDFAEGKTTDDWLEKTLTPANKLTGEDKRWILENFFFCNWDTMIYPNPRFAELFEKRGKFSSKEDIKRISAYFTPQEYLDLQVWFNLAWMDPMWQEKDSLILLLYKKSRNFTEEDKLKLVEKQKEICRLTIEKHKELWHKGQIEISTTPFYHPILPLLCDTDIAQTAMPGSLKPRIHFQHSEDARHQVSKALEFMENVFGKRPVGMWPSEGSVSEEVAAILSECGLKWAATDEGIVFQSLRRQGMEGPRTQLYQPYWIETQGKERLQMVFRDHALSDAIGFIYARMDPKKAVEDFIGHIVKIAEAVPSSGTPPLVSVILDGENCWESYPKDGQEFLKLLYRSLSEHPKIETTTIGDFIQKYPAKNRLKNLWPGSWINSDYSIWIGHPEDNIAWDLLSEARQFLVNTLKSHPEKASEPGTQQAWESLYIAEGSDWCWWYGDQNSTAHDETFDELFRSHLKNVYLFMGEQPPQKLSTAIKSKEKRGRHIAPVELITPKVDGLVTNYYEWRAGGYYSTESTGGAMHQAENFLSAIYYGFDLEKLYIRLDTKLPLSKLPLNEVKIKIHFIEPADYELEIFWENEKIKALFTDKSGQTKTVEEAAAKKIIEAAIPFYLLPVQDNDDIEFVVLVLKQGIGFERWPYQSSIHLKRPTAEFGADLWSV